ncbi:MAG TPA: amidohydrolase family protein [Planctomycetota bacterium]|nr:amidohydrolase family protein [Planctomycetota bacterium]
MAVDADHHLAPGEVVWDASGRIVAVRSARGRVEDLCLLPGLVDAHVHLQIEPLARVERRFVRWVSAVLAARRGETVARQRAATRTSIGQLLATGTTAVGEIDSTGLSRAVLARSQLGGRCYRELTGFHLDGPAAVRLVRSTQRRGAGRVAAGLSPHAPYSVSADLFRQAAAASEHLAVHCAEVPEEQEFLRSGRGAFATLLAGMGRLPAGFRAPGVGAVRWLEQLGVLRATTQLVHCQELERGDAARIAAAGASIAVCPGTIEWFRRTPPPVPSWLRLGIPVALGTDSRASNAGFSMVAELQRASRFWPGLSPAQLLAMATLHGGAALGDRGLGRLRRAGRADILAVPAGATFDRTLEHFVQGQLSPVFVVCGGRRRAGAVAASGA